MRTLCFAACLMGLAGGCAGRIPLPENLEVSGTAELLQRMEEARSPLGAYVADARVLYFGAKGRAKISATLAVKRPSSMYWELIGPHGGTLEAFATNGVEMQLADMGKSRFTYGPATVSNLDMLLPVAPLHLSAQQWTRLLLGEVQVPSGATVNYDDKVGRFVLEWGQASRVIRVEVDPRTSQVKRARVWEAQVLVTDVQIESRDAHGLPAVLLMKAPAADLELEVTLTHVEGDPPLDDEKVFRIDPPADFELERLP